MGRSLRLLIVDDNEDDARLAVNQLEESGFCVTWSRVQSGEEFDAALQSGPWDAVISEHTAPKYDSLVAVKTVREFDAGLPFILVSGSIGEEAAVAALKAGVSDYVTKTNLARLPHVVERELREAEIRKSHERTRRILDQERRQLLSLFDSLNHIVYVVDPATYEVLYANQFVKSLIGRDPVGGLCYEEFQQFDIPCDFCPNENVLRLNNGSYEWEYHNWYLDKDFVASDRIIRWTDGRDVKFHIGLDVTARKKAEQELRRSELRNRALIEQSPIGIAIVQNEMCVYANPTLLKFLRAQSHEEVCGHSVFDALVPEHRDSARSFLDAILSGEQSEVSLQCRGFRKSGEELDMEIWPRQITLNGGAALLLFVADTTETKRLWGQLVQAQKMEALGTLAGGVAHDFNNLLTIVTGYCELMVAEQALPDNVRGDLQTIIQAGRSGAELVQRLLAFSRNAESKPRPVNLNLQVMNLKRLLARTLPKMIDIEVNLADGLAMVHADPTQIDQVLMNLAVNAKDAMPDGGKLTITIENTHLEAQCFWMHPEIKPGKYVQISVADTGVGMDKATLEHMFEPFFSTKGTGKGTGLGLSMVYGIVQQHQGHITCSSEPGKGTKFEIYLPVPEEPTFEAGEQSDEPTTLRGTETILIVDDEEPVRDLGQRILARAGYTVLAAPNGQQGLEIYRDRKAEIALVILDLVMPGMGGKECLAELLACDPSARVLIASGLLTDRQTKGGLESSAVGFITKPFEINTLLRSVRAALDAALPKDSPS
ncbi:MAG: response regulator [Desulfomonile sp.]|nr:response regulator [Desulfomonile sp.]